MFYGNFRTKNSSNNGIKEGSTIKDDIELNYSKIRENLHVLT